MLVPAGRRRILADRREPAWDLCDIRTVFTLIVGMVLAVRLDAACVFVVLDLMLIESGLAHRLPMAVRPLKAVAMLVTTQRNARDIPSGAGLAFGEIMLALSGGVACTCAR